METHGKFVSCLSPLEVQPMLPPGLKALSQPPAGSRLSPLFNSGKEHQWPLRALGSAPAWRPLPLALPALTRRPEEDGALTAGGRAPPPSARRRAPSSSAGTPRRSTAEPASAASYPLALGTCKSGKGLLKCQSGISISRDYHAPRFSWLSLSLFDTKGISQVAKKRKKKKEKNFLWSLSALTYLGISYCNCAFSKTTQAKRDQKENKTKQKSETFLCNDNNEMFLYMHQW